MISINEVDKNYTFSPIFKNIKDTKNVEMYEQNMQKVTMIDGKTYYIRDFYKINGPDFVNLTDLFDGKIFLNRRYIVKVEPVKVVEIRENDLEVVNTHEKKYEKYITYSFYEIPINSNAIGVLSNNDSMDWNGNKIIPFKSFVDKKLL